MRPHGVFLLLFQVVLATGPLAIGLGSDLHAQYAWRHFGDLNEGRNFFGAIPIGDGKVLVAGGYKSGGFGQWGVQMENSLPTASCEIIDAAAGTVVPTGTMISPRTESVFLLTPDSSVVAISGISGARGALTPSVELYDRASGTWRLIGNLNIPRRQHTACFISNDEVLVVGGRHEYLTAMADAEIFNIRTGHSRKAATYMLQVSTPVSAVAPDGRIIVFSGRVGGAGSYRSPNVHEYDRHNDRWLKVGEIPDAINAPFLTMLWNGDIVMAGGATTESPLTQPHRVLRYSRDGFQTVGLINLSRSWHGQAQFEEQSLILTGGLMENGYPTARCEVIDLVSGIATEFPKLAKQRKYLQTVSVPVWIDGYMRLKILVIAGQDETQESLTSIEVLEQESPEFVARPVVSREGDFLVASEADSYQWHVSGDPIAGATEQRFNAKEQGIYTVTVRKDGWTTTSLPYYLTALSVEDERLSRQLGVFPNPSTDRVMIDLDLQAPVPLTLELADMLGEVVIRFDEGIRSGPYRRDIPMGDLPSGAYLLRVKAGEGSTIRKIVKE